MTAPTTQAAREIRLVIEMCKTGLGTPKITGQRLKLWLDEIEAMERKNREEMARVASIYQESLQQIKAELDALVSSR